MLSTGADVVRQPSNVTRVTHEDSGLDLVESACTDGHSGACKANVGVATTTECVVRNLSALTVPNDDKLGAGAFLVERVDCGGDCTSSCQGGLRIGGATTRRLTSAGGVIDGLCSGTRVGVQDQVDNDTRGAIASRRGGFARSKDMDLGAALTFLEFDRGGGGQSGEGKGSGPNVVDDHHVVL